MLTLPAPILNYLYTTTLANRSPAYLLISKDGQLQDWGGQLNLYGISDLQRAETASRQIFFLEGLLPLEEAELFLPRLQTRPGTCADIYLFSDTAGDWVLLLDATIEEFQHSLLQQYRNDLNLLHTQQSQLVTQQLVTQQVGNAATELPDFLSVLPDGERKDLTILFVDLRDFVSYSEQNSPRTVFRALNLYLRSIVQSIMSEAGIVNKLFCNEVMACFGVLPTYRSTAIHAIQSALKMLETVQEINQLRQADHQASFEVGIGIASGPISLGILGYRQHKTLGAIGHYVNLAATLQQQANPGEILIDANTFNQAEPMQQYFSAIDRSVAKLTETVQIYSFVQR